MRRPERHPVERVLANADREPRIARLNWIEPEFAALRYFALGGTDHHTHAWQGEMIDRYIRWRNAHAQPKTSFAPNSVIRTWTGCQTNVALRGTSTPVRRGCQ